MLRRKIQALAADLEGLWEGLWEGIRDAQRRLIQRMIYLLQAAAEYRREFSRRLERIQRRLKREVLLLVLISTVRVRRFDARLRTQLIKLGRLPWILISPLVGAAVEVVLVYRHRILWQAAAERLAVNGTLPQLEIAIGAAVLGVIGIVFSLSIFSIQQVAERGTSLTIREYARDPVFRGLFWTLALFAFFAMLSALQKPDLALYAASLNIGILAITAVILKVYFDRAMKFVDPHFTIAKAAKRARNALVRVQRLERAVEDEIRYQRFGKRT